MEKLFTFSNRERQYLRANHSLGRILMRPEVDEKVSSLNSRVVRILNNSNEIYIEPPLEISDLDRLGETLVDLANKLDPTPPPARYTID